MALVVNSNIASINAQRNLGKSNNQVSKSVEKLSSGLRINRAADDAAGFAIATKANAQVRGLNQAVRNANNAISLVQVAEGGINNLSNILHRLRELAVQSSSDDNTTSDREMLTTEADNLIAEFTRVSNTTEFNNMALLDGSFSGKYFQVGANYGQQLTFNIGDARGKSIGGRAQYDADVTDGLTNAVDANFGGSEIKINGYGVQATNSSDDQYSVLELSTSSLGGSPITGTSDYGTYSFTINNTYVNVTLASDVTAASVVDVVVSAINGAGITNVSAVAIGSTWTLKASKGTDLQLGLDGASTMGVASALSVFGLNVGQISTMWGSVATSDADVTSYNGQSSALAKSVSINSVKSNSQVTSTVQKNTVTGTASVAAGSISSGDVWINGVNIGAVTVTAGDGTGALVSAINAQTSTTGVTASTNAEGKLILTATDGRNITVTTKDATVRGYMNLNSSQFTGGTAVFRSTIRLNSESEISLTGALGDLYEGANDYTETTDTSKSVAVDLATYNVAAIAVDTQDNAQAAVLTVDAALNDLNFLRSQIGAIQNRIEFMIANLEIASENMFASESRIKDADFAFDTTKFTGNQVLLQAGTAMLAQANTMPQMALQLLK